MNEAIYLDYNATTPTAPAVVNAMLPFLGKIYGNPSSQHQFGRAAAAAIVQARSQLATLLGAQPEEIIFTSGGTSANNLALEGAAAMAPKDRRHLIISSIEHSSVLQCCREMVKDGWTIAEAPVDRDGHLLLDRVAELIRPETWLISVMLANNETGAIQPIREIARLAAENGILMHTDAVQAIGKIPVNPTQLGVDLLTLSGHKFYGPKGIGALYIRNGVTLRPRSFGGGQEKGLTPGTENVPGIVGIGHAAELVARHLNELTTRQHQLLNYLENRIRNHLQEAEIITPQRDRLPNTLSVSFPGIINTDLVARLDARGFAVSTGAACSSTHADRPSHVLLASGRTTADAMSAVRISFGLETTQEQLHNLVETIIAIFNEELRHRHSIHHNGEIS